MANRTILLIEDNAKTAAALRDYLKRQFQVEVVKGADQAAAWLAKRTPDLIIIDFDLKAEDGLQVFKKLGTTVKVIMLSASGNIPLAVSATKLGVAEFLRKPVEAGQLKEAVERSLPQEALRLHWTSSVDWLRSGSPAVKRMLDQIQQALQQNRDIALVGERGIAKAAVAEFIHQNSPQHKRQLVKVDVTAFRREDLEAHFWTTVQELMALPDKGSVKDLSDRCGTIYLENIDRLDEHFQMTIFKFFQERRGKADKSIRAIIGLDQEAKPARDLTAVNIPALRERREDLPKLLELYLRRAARRCGKPIRFVSSSLLDWLSAYDWPGNYQELRRLIEEAVLLAPSDKLDLANFPLDYRGLAAQARHGAMQENLSLAQARQRFEKILYPVLLDKLKGEKTQLARFLDISRTTLTERLENLPD